ERELAVEPEERWPSMAVLLAQLADDHPAEALALGERAFKIYDASEGMLPGELDAHFHRARALIATGGDRTRALADAELARSETHKLGPGKLEALTEIEGWLTEQTAK
ncbi:MAG TPA: hypothetical protein VGB85_19390, partial [Nannocystis sp.]